MIGQYKFQHIADRVITVRELESLNIFAAQLQVLK